MVHVNGHDVWQYATMTYYLLLDSLHFENQNDYLEFEFEELVSSKVKHLCHNLNLDHVTVSRDTHL